MKFEDNKELKVEGQGTIATIIQRGKVKLSHNVQFVPKLAHNLISVGQLLVIGYSVSFDDTLCTITDKKTGKCVVSIYKTLNNMFPLGLTDIHEHNLNVECGMNTKLWLQRFGHLNAKNLKLLKIKDMVHGMNYISYPPKLLWYQISFTFSDKL